MHTAKESPTETSWIGPSLDDFIAAQTAVASVVRPTPLQSSRFLAEHVGVPIGLKCENLQRTGSYKIRGAYNRLFKLDAGQRARGVVAASAGNHAQGVALAARELGIHATIFMPVGVALPKYQATRAYGADVVLVGSTFEETLESALKFTSSTGVEFIPPFDHPDIVAGQGTLGLEILRDAPDVRTVVVPVGGGGLISGVASALKQRAQREGREIRVFGVQAENAAAYPVSLAAGQVLDIPQATTIADGIAVRRPGNLNFEMVQRYVDDVVTVSEDDIARALLVLLERAKLVVEPAGAVSVAALLAGALPVEGHTVAILSGGNIDPLLMQRVISHGLAASDRYLTLSIMLPDRPGQLSRIADVLASVNANVVEVLHTRHGRGLQISEVELEVSVETRDAQQQDEVIAALRTAGYSPTVIDD